LTSDTVRIDTLKTAPKARSRASGIALADSWAVPALVWVVHWMLTQIPATLAYHYGTIKTFREYGPDSGAWGIHLPPLDGLAGWLVEPLRNWDGTWYATVANEGYNTTHTANAAFWPLYPWLMRLGSDLTGWSAETIGYLVSNITFFFALWFLYRLVTLDFDPRVAQRTLWGIALFPTAFFFTAVYTESLFLLLVVASLYYARRGEWLVAGIVGLLAALTRSAGVMLLAPFGILFLQQYGWAIRNWFPRAFAAALPALGPVIFGWHLAMKNPAGHDWGSRDWRWNNFPKVFWNSLKDSGFVDWAEVQWQWNRFSATPWRTFDCAINGCTADVRQFGTTREFPVRETDWGWIGQLFDNLNWTFFTSTEFRFRVGESHVLEFIVSVAAIILVLAGLRLVPLYYTAFVIPALVVPLLTPSSVNPLMSMPRFVLPLFPLFVVVALLVRNRTAGWVLSGISSILLVLLTMQFALWYWVS